jgi:hypothetical protein
MFIRLNLTVVIPYSGHGNLFDGYLRPINTSMHQPSVLVVEDEENIRETLTIALTLVGFKVVLNWTEELERLVPTR